MFARFDTRQIGPRQPDRRAPIYQQLECDTALACRLAASGNRVGRSPTGGPLIRPSDPCRGVGEVVSMTGKPWVMLRIAFDQMSLIKDDTL